MSDQDFRERVLESLSRIEEQARENNARVEKRLDSRIPASGLWNAMSGG